MVQNSLGCHLHCRDFCHFHLTEPFLPSGVNITLSHTVMLTEVSISFTHIYIYIYRILPMSHHKVYYYLLFMSICIFPYWSSALPYLVNVANAWGTIDVKPFCYRGSFSTAFVSLLTPCPPSHSWGFSAWQKVNAWWQHAPTIRGFGTLTIPKQISGLQLTYMATDCLKEINRAGLASSDSVLNYAAKQTPPGLFPHTLQVKVHSIYRLIRNFSIDHGLVKNTRVIMTELGNRLITVRLMHQQGNTLYADNDDVLIPRISFTHILPSSTLLCHQFPLTLGYAMTFNSCQGLNLDCAGVDLTYPVFSHGQLYTALFRIPDRTCAVRQMCPAETSTLNVMYHELLL
jgi:hypothetical protein